jgi:hypothetical protein
VTLDHHQPRRSGGELLGSRGRGPGAEFFGHFHEIGEGFRLHFFHGFGTVGLHGDFADAKLSASEAEMERRSRRGPVSTVKDVADAVTYLTDAETVTVHILYVDGGAHFGCW